MDGRGEDMDEAQRVEIQDVEIDEKITNKRT